ncbi:translocation/assembly module TamB domain-containing protein [Sphingomonas profundi]|uniref:translocation/assembly module TamB domain-containing protein n=1 Tax=Alterirhizorhabdus profundi TaxID=2681549 RepID=UPI0012E7596A|nr:translocation/assembly module TamB domain-containing protein [Sphingomonas profundi]
MNPALRTTLKWVGIGLAAIVLIVAALLVGINTGPGRAFMARQIGGFTTESGMAFHVDRIDGSIYGRMTLVGLEVRDPKGAFLTAPAVTVDWRPFAYINSKVDVREASAATMTLLRLPELKPVPSDPNAPTLPDIDLAIGRLAIDRFVVEPPVTGKRHIVRLAGSADIADGRARINADADAIRAAGVAGGDRLTLRLDAVPDANRLLIDAKLAAPAGGLVDSYAGLGKPVSLSIDGRGDWANWAGRASGTVGGQVIADLALTGRDGTFAARGDVMPGVILTGPAARLTEPAIAIDATAKLADRKADTVLHARSAAMAVDAAGLIDLANSRLGGFRVQGQLLRPGAIADNAAGRDIRFAATLDGPFATPTVEYRLSAAAASFGTMGIEGVQASGRAVIDTDRIRIPVNATARRVTGLNAAAGGLLTNIAINGNLAYTGGRLISDNIRLRSDRIDATAIVIADFGKGTYTGALKGRVNDYQVDGLGRINLVTDANLVTGPKGGFGIKGRVRVTTRRLDNASIRDQLGGNAVITADVGFDEDGIASVSNLRVTAPNLRVTGGSGRYAPDGRIAFRAQGQSKLYGPFSVTASGTLERPVVKLVAPRPYVGVQLSNVEATLTGSAAGYRVVARGGSPYGPFNADVLIRSGRGPLAIDIATARFAGVDFRGNLVATPAGPFAGTLTLAGSGLNGTVRLAAAGANQRADVDVRASAARIPGDVPITIGRGVIRATAILYPNAPSIQASAALADVTQGSFVLTSLQGRVNYQGGRGTAAVIAKGRSGVPFDIAAQAALSPTLIRANAKGSVNNLAFRLASPAEIRKAGAEWVLSPATVVLPQGQVLIAGRYGATTQATARLNNLDLSIVQAAVPGLGLGGKASGTVEMRLPAGGGLPVVDARLNIARFTRTGALVVSQPVDIALLGRLDNTAGDVRALIRRGGAVVGRMQARLAPIPAGASISDRLFAAALSGGVRYNGPAEVLWTLTGIAGQQVSGPVAVAADFSGRLGQPNVTGIVRANALRYENDVYGTTIANIAVDGRFTQNRFELAKFTGNAGTGTIAASGYVGLDAASGFPMDIRVNLRRAQLARSEAIAATVSGTLAISNSKAAGALIKGDLTIPEVRYEIIRQGAAEVAELEGVRRKNAPPVKPVAETVPSNWKLDIRVRADNRIFVSGMGLEAEWSTDMRIGGTATRPVIVGDLDVLRGTYSFAGRRFELANSSKVTFDGGDFLNPQLNISASTTVESVTATIAIAGRAQAPQISFTSTPNLPQDEVLSRLLFGSSVTSLSPTQAIQLAAALNSLRGSGGGGLNPLGKLRSATGIDRLRVLGADKTAGRGTALAAGQYISNDIYVEVITDARGFTATQLEISLSKALSVLSQTGSFGGSSVNLRYSKDY